MTLVGPWDFLQKNKMDGRGDMGLFGEHFDPCLVGRIKEDGYESRSGSDNIEGASGEDQDVGDDQRPRKKYNRHTANQIQELESYEFFLWLCYLYMLRDLCIVFTYI
jgi:homeobox-leucine zipper protein